MTSSKLTSNCRKLWAISSRLRGRGQVAIGARFRCDAPLVCNGEGSVTIGDDVGIGYPLAPKLGSGSVLIQARPKNATIIIGDRTEFSNNISIIAINSIKLGEDCLISDLVSICDSDFHDLDPKQRAHPKHRSESDGQVRDVVIGNNVWICSRALILSGARIGDDSVVAAGAVVRGEFPNAVLIGGVPARTIRSFGAACPIAPVQS